MLKYSISFIVLAVLLGLFLGAVLGSLLDQVFGLQFLNQGLFDGPLALLEDFYLIQRLEIQLTPASILGLIATVWILYKHGRKTN